MNRHFRTALIAALALAGFLAPPARAQLTANSNPATLYNGALTNAVKASTNIFDVGACATLLVQATVSNATAAITNTITVKFEKTLDNLTWIAGPQLVITPTGATRATVLTNYPVADVRRVRTINFDNSGNATSTPFRLTVGYKSGL